MAKIRPQEVPLPLNVDQSRPLSVFRVKNKKPLLAVFCCDWWYGCHTHYYDDRTVLCPGPDNCIVCECGGETRWYGFIVACNTMQSRYCLLQVTGNAAKSILSQMPDETQSESGLLGLCVLFKRRTGDKRSELIADVDGTLKSPILRVWTKSKIEENVRRIFGKPFLPLKLDEPQ